MERDNTKSESPELVSIHEFPLADKAAVEQVASPAQIPDSSGFLSDEPSVAQKAGSRHCSETVDELNNRAPQAFNAPSAPESVSSLSKVVPMYALLCLVASLRQLLQFYIPTWVSFCPVGLQLPRTINFLCSF